MDDRLASTFEFDSVAVAYGHRPPYPDEALDLLADLVVGSPRRILDLGAGDGSLARPLTTRVDEVHAVEPSEAMVAVGRRGPGGADPRLTWSVGSAETYDGPGPFGLATAGAVLHWLDLPVLVARLRGLLRPGAPLVALDRTADLPGLREAILPIIKEHSRSQAYVPPKAAIDAMSDGSLWSLQGTHTTAPVSFRQSIDDYIEALHSTASLARDLMSPAESADFDAGVRAALVPFADGSGVLDLQLTATLVWGVLDR